MLKSIKNLLRKWWNGIPNGKEHISGVFNTGTISPKEYVYLWLGIDEYWNRVITSMSKDHIFIDDYFEETEDLKNKLINFYHKWRILTRIFLIFFAGTMSLWVPLIINFIKDLLILL